MMRENLHIPPKPDLGSTQSIMDYTTVPVGLCIKGKMWTGQATTFTERCPKCGRIGVVSVTQNDKRVMVHQGRVAGADDDVGPMAELAGLGFPDGGPPPVSTTRSTAGRG